MDIPLEEGMPSPGAADMRPGEQSACSFPSACSVSTPFHYSVREPFPVHPTCEERGKYV